MVVNAFPATKDLNKLEDNVYVIASSDEKGIIFLKGEFFNFLLSKSIFVKLIFVYTCEY